MTKPLPYALQKIEIDRFQCIKKTCIQDLTNRTPWIFLVGENGDGKTAFLQALTIGVCGAKNALNILEQQRENCRIRLWLWEDGQYEYKELSWDQETQLHTHLYTPREWGPGGRPDYYCAYGPSRLEIQGDQSIGQERENIDPEKFDISKYEAFLDALCGTREFQKEAIRLF